MIHSCPTNDKLLGSEPDDEDLSRLDLALESEFWRIAHLRWQEWGTALLRELGLQPEGGLWGDEQSIRLLDELARKGASRSADPETL